MTHRNTSLPFLLLLLALLLFFVSPVRAIVKLEYLGPYPLTPQPLAAATLRTSAIVGNAGDETGNYTFALKADQAFTSHFIYSFWVNNMQVRSFSLDAGRRQIFFVNFTFIQGTPALNYTATISISAVPTSAQSGIGGVGSLSVPVWISASYVTGTSTLTTIISTSITAPTQTSTVSAFTTSSHVATASTQSPTVSTSITTAMQGTELFTQTSTIAIAALALAVIILGAMYLRLRTSRPPERGTPQHVPQRESEKLPERKTSKEKRLGLEKSDELPQRETPKDPEDVTRKQFCTRCGADLTAGAKYCDKCGLPLNAG